MIYSTRGELTQARSASDGTSRRWRSGLVSDRPASSIRRAVAGRPGTEERQFLGPAACRSRLAQQARPIRLDWGELAFPRSPPSRQKAGILHELKPRHDRPPSLRHPLLPLPAVPVRGPLRRRAAHLRRQHRRLLGTLYPARRHLATDLDAEKAHEYAVVAAFFRPLRYNLGSGAIHALRTRGGQGVDTAGRPAERPVLACYGDSITANQSGLRADASHDPAHHDPGNSTARRARTTPPTSRTVYTPTPAAGPSWPAGCTRR